MKKTKKQHEYINNNNKKHEDINSNNKKYEYIYHNNKKKKGFEAGKITVSTRVTTWSAF